MSTALAARLRDAAEWLAEEIPEGTAELSELEGDVRLDELDLYCVGLMRQAAKALDPTPAESGANSPTEGRAGNLAGDEHPSSSPPQATNQSDRDDAVGCAEREVGRYVYKLVEARMDAKPGTPESAELAYLARIVSDVEEYGADELSVEEIASDKAPTSPPQATNSEVEKLREALGRLTKACRVDDPGELLDALDEADAALDQGVGEP